MRKAYLIAAISLILFFLPLAAVASSVAKDVKEGNRLYEQGKYDDALAKYGSAGTELPDSDIVNFNVGSVMYKKGEFEKAIEAFTRALVTNDKALEASANYNIANSKYRLGNLKMNTDLSGAVGSYRQALDYYKRAIELNQDDTDARYNHELVEKKLKVLLDRLRNQPEQEESGGESEEQNQDQEGKKGQQPTSESREEKQAWPELGKEEQAEEASGTEERQGQQTEEQERADKDEGIKGQHPSDDEMEKMSPEEAKMLLDAYGEEEYTQMQQHGSGTFDEVLKDW